MNKKYHLTLIISAAMIAIIAPVLIAVHLSYLNSLNNKTSQILYYAKDIQFRSDNTIHQVSNAISKLEAAKSSPCSSDKINIMRNIDLSYSYIQMIGYISDNKIVCSSLGKLVNTWDIGPVDYYGKNGYGIRLNVKAPFSGDKTYLAIQKGNYIALIHKQLPIDTTLYDKNITLAIYAIDTKKILITYGVLKNEWLKLLENANEVTVYKDGYIVAAVKSGVYNIGAIAASPYIYLNKHTLTTAYLLLPIGLLASLILGMAVFYWARYMVSLPVEIKTALARDDFFLVYQPIIDLTTGSYFGVEALMRWVRPNGEIVDTNLFIEAAEHAGTIQLITKKVFQLLTKDASSIFKKHPDFVITINISTADLNDGKIITLLRNLIRDTNANANNYIVEVTERGLVKKGVARQAIQHIRKLGVRVSLDDFGLGYANLSYLETLKFDYLKIDKLFIDALGSKAPISHVIYHIIKMGEALKLKMIAEGVETLDQAEFLRMHGIHYAQGFFYAEPMTLHQVMERLDSMK